MKRFHVHLAVSDLAESVRFYSSLFGAPPTVEKPDYAKWMLEDPRLNFAISSAGGATGLSHLGFQVDSAGELAALREQASRAGREVRDEPGASCCYAQSDKHWARDPQGIAWEAFHTTGVAEAMGCSSGAVAQEGTACCAAPAALAGTKTSSRCCA